MVWGGGGMANYFFGTNKEFPFLIFTKLAWAWSPISSVEEEPEEMRQTNLILVQRVLDASQGKPSQPSSQSLANTQSNDNQHSYIFSKHHKLQFHGHSDTCNTNIYSARGPSVIHFCSWNLVLCVDALHLHVVMPVALQKKGYVTSDAN